MPYELTWSNRVASVPFGGMARPDDLYLTINGATHEIGLFYANELPDVMRARAARWLAENRAKWEPEREAP